MYRFLLIVSLLPIISSSSLARNPVDLAKRQCRSVHLGFKMKEATALYNEVVVKKSAPGTYSRTIQWQEGDYFFGLG